MNVSYRPPGTLKAEFITLAKRLVFLGVAGGLMWGIAVVYQRNPDILWNLAVLLWKGYSFASFPILCWIVASLVVKAFFS